MTVHQSFSGESSWSETQLVVAEYSYLREEIIKLTELQFQTTAATVLAFGTVMSVGIQVHNAAIVLIYPMLSLILGVTWLHYANLIARISIYTRDHIESRVGHHNIGWENYVDAHPLPRGRFAYWGIRLVFVASSVLAITVSLPIATPSIAVVLLYSLAVSVTAATVIIFIIWGEPSPELNSNYTF